MARRDHDQEGAVVPEADRLDQETAADPSIGTAWAGPDPVTPEVDEADRLEQALEVLADPDEEYAPSPREG